MDIIFMGTPPFAVQALRALHHSDHNILAVFTQPPRPGNRGRLTKTAVHDYAAKEGLRVFSPDSFSSATACAQFQALGAEAAVVAAYGLILPEAILGMPKRGCINIHASLLPRWRGAAPIQRAILAGDTETGISIMQMERGLDTGPVLKRAALPIHRQTAGELTAELGELGGRLILETLDDIDDLSPVPQPEQGVYAKKIRKEEAEMDWRQNAQDLDRLVRAMQPSPGAWFDDNGSRVKVLQARLVDGAPGTPGTLLPDGTVLCGHGALLSEHVQPAGKKRMPVADWLRGRRGPPVLGTR